MGLSRRWDLARFAECRKAFASTPLLHCALELPLRFKLGAALIPFAIVAQAQQQHVEHRQKLGTVHFATSCNASAQPEFNRAVVLLHSFNFKSAIEGFNNALKADPKCAMSYWGVALSDWGNPFAAGLRPAAQLERGAEAIRLARATGSPTERELGYINAAAHLYDNFQTVDQPTRLLAYRDAMADLSSRNPADTEAAIFYALALAISAPPTDKTNASLLKAGAILEKLFAAQPDHPGLAHYIIHAYDVPSLAPRALLAARRYSEIAPEEAHALHMPSHTYKRVGYWQKSIDANVASSAVAQRQGAGAEELHASDYRVYAYLQTGQDRAAKQVVDALPDIAKRFDPKALGIAAPPAAGFYALAAIPVRYALERGDWKGAMNLELRPSPFAPANATTHFARAIGAAQLGDTIVPRASVDALQQIHDKLVEQKENYWAEQVEIQRIGASAWLAFAQHRKDDALSAMRNAADREDATEKNAITPGPIAPARELLGMMLLQSHEPLLAQKEFEATLVKEPNRFRAVAGAAESAAAAGDRAVARHYYAQLLQISARADTPARPELIAARRSLR